MLDYPSSSEQKYVVIKQKLEIRPSRVTNSAKRYFETESKTLGVDILIHDLGDLLEEVKNDLLKIKAGLMTLSQMLDTVAQRNGVPVMQFPSVSKEPQVVDLTYTYTKVQQALFEMMCSRLVDNFETYLADIIREAIRAQPKMLRSGDQVRLDYILEFESLDDLLTGLIERKVSELAYLGFANLEKWFEERIGLGIAIEETVRETVIEVIETRNIIVHNRGDISEKYLRNVPKSSLKVGQHRAIDLDYLIVAVDVLDTLVISVDERVGGKFSLKTDTL